jgi:hypothetical protein
VVRRLGADAELIRARIAEIDSLAPLGEEMTVTRQEAEARLHQVVGALETIRIDLLRLHAGTGTAAGVTADLSAAQELSDDIARHLEGVREVERLLGRPPTRELTSTPTPA